MEQLTADEKKAADVKRVPSTFDGAYAAAIMPKAPVAPPSAIVVMSKTNAPSICTPDQLNCID
jgi:hypothetical protein